MKMWLILKFDQFRFDCVDFVFDSKNIDKAYRRSGNLFGHRKLFMLKYTLWDNLLFEDPPIHGQRRGYHSLS